MSRQSIAKVKRFCVATGKLCCDMVGQAGKISVAIELAKVMRNYVTTGNGGNKRFSVATGLSVSQQRLS